MGNSTEFKNSKVSGTGRTGRFIIVMVALVLLLFFALVLNINTGSVYISPAEIVRLLSEGLNEASTESVILFRIRLPRMLLAAVLGGALSVSGYLLQVFFRNPIAGPFVLGISSGAKMLVGFTLISFYGFTGGLSSLSLIVAAFAGSLIITGVVLLFAQKVRNMSMLLVIGIMVGYICSAVTDFFITFAHDHDVVNLTTWSMGSFSGANWGNVKMALLFCIPGLIIALLMSKPIGAYALGEGYAKSMGINVKLFRIIIILLSSLLSGCVTALAGPISFVGIAVPHITKSLLKSSRPAFVIPSVFLCGAVFCVFCDLIARTIVSPTELAIGTVTSVLGAPVVIYMMIKRRRQSEE
ncbi:MAG: iron ABC transporter permease [Firmicutes bacterium]|nr:iron ABC transporter permease [Bacillota bacterium]